MLLREYTNLHEHIKEYITQDEKLRYQVVDAMEHIYFRWHGEYTVGNTSVRGTRLWFRRNAATPYIKDTGWSYSLDELVKDEQDLLNELEDSTTFSYDDVLN